jgi:predicted glycogen debranching enzyme
VKAVVRRYPWPGEGRAGWADLLTKEWLVTNGLGGYAAGTVCGVPTRRFHGLLVAALPTPFGRTMMLTHIAEEVYLRDGSRHRLGGEEREPSATPLPGTEHLKEFGLDAGLPMWSYEVG